MTDNTDMAFQQGIVLEKHGVGNHGGRRIVRLNGDYLEWSKLNRQVWQPERDLLKSHIRGIYMASQVHPAAFRVESDVRDPVTFVAVSVDSCRKIVHALQAWASSKLTAYSGLRRGSAPARPNGSSGMGQESDSSVGGFNGAAANTRSASAGAWMPPTEAQGNMTSGQALANGGGTDQQLSWNRQQDLKRISARKDQMAVGGGGGGGVGEQKARKPVSRFRAAAMAINAGLSRTSSNSSRDKPKGYSGQQSGGAGYYPPTNSRPDSWNPNNVHQQQSQAPVHGANSAIQHPRVGGVYDGPERSGLM
jgi:hypothetical protein